MSKIELACVYATLLLHECRKDINAQNIKIVTKAAKIEVDPLWASAFAKFVDNDALETLITKLTKPCAVDQQEENKEAKPKKEEMEQEPESDGT